ncbi:unnamed protein product [Phaeothamnion confervicola]
MVRIHSLSDATGCEILAKAEFLNPGGTGKDRIALGMIEDAEARGVLTPAAGSSSSTGSATGGGGTATAFPRGTVVEGTSGSTGVSLALLCAARGYRCVVVLPDDQAAEKAALLRCLGAEVVVVRPAAIASPEHYVNVARRVAAAIPGAVFMDQFENEANWQAHLARTMPEIWRQTGGRIDAFVMGAGTGGTIAAAAVFLRERGSGADVWLVDPPGSSLFHAVRHGVCYAPQQAERTLRRHRYDSVVEGIGLDRITANFAHALTAFRAFPATAAFGGGFFGGGNGSGSSGGGVGGGGGGVFRVSDQEAVDMAHFLLRREGLFVGCSSAMNAVGAVRAARRLRRLLRERRRLERRWQERQHRWWWWRWWRRRLGRQDSEVRVGGAGDNGERDWGAEEEEDRGEERPVLVTVLCDGGARGLSRFWNRDFIEGRGLRWPEPADFLEEGSKLGGDALAFVREDGDGGGGGGSCGGDAGGG